MFRIARSLVVPTLRSQQYRLTHIGLSECNWISSTTRLSRCFHSNDEKQQEKTKSKKEKSGGLFSSLNSGKIISLSEARQIFDIPDGEEPNYEVFGKKWKLLRENNNPEKGGSAYLLAKITNAKKRLEKEYGELKEEEPEKSEKPAEDGKEQAAEADKPKN